MAKISIDYDSSDEANVIYDLIEKHLNNDDASSTKESILKMINSKLSDSFEKGRNIQMVLDEAKKSFQVKSTVSPDSVFFDICKTR